MILAVLLYSRCMHTECGGMYGSGSFVIFTLHAHRTEKHVCRVDHNRINAPFMTVYLVISLLQVP